MENTQKETPETQNDAPEPVTRPLTMIQRTALSLFKIGLVIFLLSGIVLVIIQAFGLAIGNEELTVTTIPGLTQTMTITAGITGLIAFAMSYIFKWDTSGED
jgi:hypothetical protein